MDAHNAGELGLWLTMACILMWAYGFIHWNSFRFTNKCMCYSKIWSVYPHLDTICTVLNLLEVWVWVSGMVSHWGCQCWALGPVCPHTSSLPYSANQHKTKWHDVQMLPGHHTWSSQSSSANLHKTKWRADASWTQYMVIPVIFCKPTRNKVTWRADASWTQYMVIPVIFCKPTQNKVTWRADASWTQHMVIPVIFCKPAKQSDMTCRC